MIRPEKNGTDLEIVLKIFFREENRNKCNNIISTLDRIESRLENTEKILQEIEEAIKNENPFEQHHTMEWDYYDLDSMETKKLK